MNTTIKAFVFWLVIVLAGILLWQVVKADRSQQATPEISYSQFLSQVDSGDVAAVKISQNQVYGRYRDGKVFRVTAPNSQEGMIQALRQQNIEIWFDSTAKADWPTWLMNLAPLILLGALWFIMIRQMRAAARGRTEASKSVKGDARPIE